MFRGSFVFFALFTILILSGPVFAQQASDLPPKASKDLNDAVTASTLEMMMHKDELTAKEIGGIENVSPLLQKALSVSGLGIGTSGGLLATWAFVGSSYIAGDMGTPSAPLGFMLAGSVMMGIGGGVAEAVSTIAPDRKEYVLNSDKINQVSREVSYYLGEALGFNSKQYEQARYGLKMRLGKAKRGEKIDLLEELKKLKENGVYLLRADQRKKVELLQQMYASKDSASNVEAAAKKTDAEKLNYLKDSTRVIWYLLERATDQSEKERLRNLARKNDDLIGKIRGRKASSGDSDAGAPDIEKAE